MTNIRPNLTQNRDVCERPQRSLSSELVDLFCLLFACWTIICNTAVLLGASLSALVGVAVPATVFLLAIRLWFHDFGRLTTFHLSSDSLSDFIFFKPDWLGRYQKFVLPGLLILLIICINQHQLFPFWIVGVLYFLALIGWEFSFDFSHRTTNNILNREYLWTRNHEFLVLAMACVFMVLTSSGYSSTLDDSFYLSLSVSAVDHPTSPLLSYDTIFGLENAPLLLPTYRVHSVELLAGALAYVTGLPVIFMAHFLIPVCVMALIPLVYAMLFRVLIPERAIWATMVVVLIIMIPMKTWPLASVLVNPQTGKSMLLGVVLPLIMYYGIRFGRSESWVDGLLLAGAQICAIGMTATALWLAPIVGFLSVAASADFSRLGIRRLAGAVASSSYVLAHAIILLLSMKFSDHGEFPGEYSADQLFEGAWYRHLGRQGRLALYCLVTVWMFCRETACRRLCVFLMLVTLMLWNPICPSLIANMVTGNVTYFRTLWLLPMIVSTAVVLTVPLDSKLRCRMPMVNHRLIAAILIGVLIGLPIAKEIKNKPLTHAFYKSVSNFKVNWKRVPRSYHIAKILSAHAGSGNRVLAPEEIEAWSTTIPGYAYPICSRRRIYFHLMKPFFSPTEWERRRLASSYINGSTDERGSLHAFRELLDEDQKIRAVCMLQSNPGYESAKPVLRELNFQNYESHQIKNFNNVKNYEIWLRVEETAFDGKIRPVSY